MCNAMMLKTYIRMSEYTVSDLCRLIGISRQTFYNRMKGKYDWKPYEIRALKWALKLTDEQVCIIFYSLYGGDKNAC